MSFPIKTSLSLQVITPNLVIISLLFKIAFTYACAPKHWHLVLPVFDLHMKGSHCICDLLYVFFCSLASLVFCYEISLWLLVAV